MTVTAFYPVLDAGLLARRGIPASTAAEALLEAGVQILQYRQKGFFSRDAFDDARLIAGLCRTAGVLFVINDRADIAALLNAALHLGQDDLPPQDARKLMPPSIHHRILYAQRAAVARWRSGTSRLPGNRPYLPDRIKRKSRPHRRTRPPSQPKSDHQKTAGSYWRHHSRNGPLRTRIRRGFRSDYRRFISRPMHQSRTPLARRRVAGYLFVVYVTATLVSPFSTATTMVTLCLLASSWAESMPAEDLPS